jgi:hypothetical protein
MDACRERVRHILSWAPTMQELHKGAKADLDGGAVGRAQKRHRTQAACLVEDLEGHRTHVQVQPVLSILPDWPSVPNNAFTGVSCTRVSCSWC